VSFKFNTNLFRFCDVQRQWLTETAVGGDDNGGNSDGRGHRQKSTKIISKDTVAVATAMETAAAGAATNAAGAPMTAPGVGAD
jgi:hypothetical protein